jgi:hypothetical protein
MARTFVRKGSEPDPSSMTRLRCEYAAAPPRSAART